MTDFTVRPAGPEEAQALTALCLRSKAHWGYDSDFMARSRASLTIETALIASGRVLVAQDASGLLGIASLAPLTGRDWDLLHLFIEPGAMGRGVGRALFAAIAQLARGFGGARLSIQADPNAADFYARMGAARCGEAPSDSIPGRMLPMLDYALDDRA